MTFGDLRIGAVFGFLHPSDRLIVEHGPCIKASPLQFKAANGLDGGTWPVFDYMNREVFELTGYMIKEN